MKNYKNIINITLKELKGFFYSPIAYIVIVFFLGLVGFFFFSSFFLYKQAELRGFFSLLPLTFSIFIPALTMKLFSEEFSKGSFEIIATMPLKINDIIIGKFLATLTFITLMLIPTFSYVIFIAFIGDLDFGPIIGGYLGAVLLGGAFASIGLLASALTKNQIISLIIGIIISFALTMFDKLLVFFPTKIVNFLQYIGADFHFQNIAKGIIDSRDIIYFLSVIIISLFITKFTIQQKTV